MDGRTAAAESKHSYPASWSHTPAGGTSAPTASSPGPQSESSSGPVSSSNVEYFPFFFPQQATLFHHQQLLQYNKLVSPGRGGGQPQPPAQAASSPATRSRSGSKVSNKDHSTGKGNQGGHGNNKPASNSEKGHRAAIANKDAAPKMPPNNPDGAHPLPARPAAPGTHNQNYSSSVPSTPLQRARNFSFESREPSPNAANSHSPRSAYSETTAHVPQLKPLPPRTSPCPFETAQLKTKRRIPYSIGNEKLDRADPSTLKRRLTEDEERKLTTDMRELYDRLLPTSEVEVKRKKLCVKLERIFNEEWPGHVIRVHAFGSSGNLLCSDDSDVDICITTDWKELEGVCIIAKLLHKRGMKNVTCISQAKVPIVKIWDPELELPCDMNVNNTVALENTRMVRTYVEIDDRVRQLAMIVKYWTRKRKINDAGTGGTLSSYTWICLVIAFLQLRDPPVLPALHQRQHQRLAGKDGAESAFADDLSQLRGFGKNNKSTLGQLLFDFFRFYAHEFDYAKSVLSVRLGRLLNRKDKDWKSVRDYGVCLEEPFNVTRDLGNTADEYSFKGLHLELRRAFDLISEGKLDECCEEYEFPKEEERVFTQTRKPQPILMRSSSQTHSGRGGRSGFRQGGRHSNNFHRGNNSSRRASSSIGFDNGSATFPPHVAQDLPWFTGVPYMSQDVASAVLAMQVQQQTDFRLQQLYQHQYLAQAAYQQSQQQQSSQSQQPASQSHPQRMPGGSSQSASSDRSRTNSFDNPPLTAPLRPEMLSPYGLHIPMQTYFPHVQPQSIYGTYPSTPSTTAGSSAEFRRSLHRSSAATEAGASTAGSSLRSQSQPASRSVPTVQTNGGSLSSSGPTLPDGVSSLPSRNNANGIPIPSFVADETEYDEGSATNGTSESPPSEDGSNTGYYLGGASSPGRATNAANGIAFGDLHQPPQGRRRMSTDLPQAVLDKRMKRVSRSPSPAGHARAFSVGNPPAPVTSSSRNPSRPLVVSSSLLSPEASSSQRNPARPTAEAQSSGESAGKVGGNEHGTDNEQTPTVSSATTERSSQSLPERPPIVVNGTNTAAASTAAAAAAAAAASVPPPMTGLPNAMGIMEEPSFRDRISMMNQAYHLPPPYFYQPDVTPMARHSTRQRGMPRQHNGVIAPLDLAVGDYKASGASGQMDLQNLSPVYEGKPPPSASSRKPKQSAKGDDQPQAPGGKARNVEGGKAKQDKHGDKTPDLKQGSATSRQVHYKTTPQGGSSHGTQKGGQAAGHERQASRAQPAGQDSSTPKSPKSPKSPASRHARGDLVNGDGGWQKAPSKQRKKGGDSKAQANGVGHGEKPPKNDSERKGG